MENLNFQPRSREIFLSFMSGKLGGELVSAYVKELDQFSRHRAPNLALQFFRMAIQAMCDSWRRFVLVTQSYPCILFNLVSLTVDKFLQEYRRLQQSLNECNECGDVEFSTPILRYIEFPNIAIASLSEGDLTSLRAKAAQLQRLLFDLATVGPLTSDIVECMHGFTQNLLHRWRGSRPTDPVAAERLAWSCITKSHGKFYQWLWSQIGDRQANRRLRRFGRRSKNQYSNKQDSDIAKQGRPQPNPDRMLSFERMDRLIAHGQSTGPGMASRKLSGYLAELERSKLNLPYFLLLSFPHSCSRSRCKVAGYAFV